MTSVMEEVAVLEQEESWDVLFQDIKQTSAEYNLPCTAAKLVENRTKNRYRDVSPYDHSRVRLVAGTNDYINSSLVNVEKADRRYILCQGPLPHTSGQLWQMVWEQNSKSVIMLNKVIEKGTTKCDQYWPLDYDNPMVFEDEGYTVALKSEKDKRNFIIRKLELTKLSETEDLRTIYQFHYTAWPDFGVPESPTAFLDFLACVREYEVLENKYGPAVIHCSAGIGRSGTFALVDTCLVFLEKGIEFNIKDTLLEMRKCRMGLIQTPHQLRFSFFAIAECERILQNRDDDSDLDESEESEEESARNGNESPASNGDYTRKEKKPPRRDESEAKSDRIRHGEPNGPSEGQKGKHEEPRHPSVSTQSSEGISQSSPATSKCSGLELTETALGMKTSNTKFPVDYPYNLPSSLQLHDHPDQDKLRRRNVEEIQDSVKKRVKEVLKKERRNPWKPYSIIGGLAAAVVFGLAIRYWYNG